MTVEVVTVTSRIPDRVKEPYYRYALWLASLARFGVTPTVLGMGEHWGGLMTKPRRLRDWLRAGGCTADALIVSDSYDVVFTASPEEVAKRYEAGWRAILFNAERGLFPRTDLEHAFPACDSPWRYLNSGFFIGSPAHILAMLEAMRLDELHDDCQRSDGSFVHPNDQGYYQIAYAARIAPMTLDTGCEVCQCMSACTLDEFDLTGERVRNIATGTEPLVWHFNGSSKDDLLPKFLEKWGLSEYI